MIYLFLSISFRRLTKTIIPNSASKFIVIRIIRLEPFNTKFCPARANNKTGASKSLNGTFISRKNLVKSKKAISENETIKTATNDRIILKV